MNGLIRTDRFRRYAADSCIRRDIMQDGRPRRDYRALANRDARPDRCASANENTVTATHATSKNGTGRNVDEFSKNAIVINRHACVDDTVFGDTRVGVDDGTGVDESSCADFNRIADDCRAMNDTGESGTGGQSGLGNAAMGLGQSNTDNNLDPGTESVIVQKVIVTEYGQRTWSGRSFCTVKKTSNRHPAAQAGIQNDLRMTTSTDNDNLRHAFPSARLPLRLGACGINETIGKRWSMV